MEVQNLVQIKPKFWTHLLWILAPKVSLEIIDVTMVLWFESRGRVVLEKLINRFQQICHAASLDLSSGGQNDFIDKTLMCLW